MTAARILLADDHAMVRKGLRMVLDAQPDLTVVAEAGDGAEAIELGMRERRRSGGAGRLDAEVHGSAGRG